LIPSPQGGEIYEKKLTRTMAEKIKKPVTNSELRKFGLLVGGVFAFGFGLILPWLFHRHFKIWPWIVGSPLFLFGLVFPPALKIPHKVWTTLAEILSWINTRIILGILFYGIFTPLSGILKLMKRDPMARRIEKSEASYRVSVKGPSVQQMEKPF